MRVLEYFAGVAYQGLLALFWFWLDALLSCGLVTEAAAWGATVDEAVAELVRDDDVLDGCCALATGAPFAQRPLYQLWIVAISVAEQDVHS